MEDIVWYFEKMYRTEKLHYQVYSYFAMTEKEKRTKKLLEKFADMEKGAAKFWMKMMLKNGWRYRKVDPPILRKGWMLFLRRVFGTAFALKAFEYSEGQVQSEIVKMLSNKKVRSSRKEVMKFLKDANRIENEIEDELLSHGAVLNNIRDIVFGMNDGLVEVLAATVGLGAALRIPSLIFAAGGIVAISGTLSMAGGAYISTKYETELRAGKNREEGHAVKSASYVGLSYIFGAIFPLLPFALGIGSFKGIVLSVAVTMLVLSFTAALVAVMSGKSISGKIIETTAISIGAAAITIMLGLYARYALHIVI